MSGHYVISKHGDGWMIAVDGARLLLCESRRTALRAVQDATLSLDMSAGTARSPCRPKEAAGREPRRAFAMMASR
jgi:hypothetical protein